MTEQEVTSLKPVYKKQTFLQKLPGRLLRAGTIPLVGAAGAAAGATGLGLLGMLGGGALGHYLAPGHKYEGTGIGGPDNPLDSIEKDLQARNPAYTVDRSITPGPNLSKGVTVTGNLLGNITGQAKNAPASIVEGLDYAGKHIANALGGPYKLQGLTTGAGAGLGGGALLGLLGGGLGGGYLGYRAGGGGKSPEIERFEIEKKDRKKEAQSKNLFGSLFSKTPVKPGTGKDMIPEDSVKDEFTRRFTIDPQLRDIARDWFKYDEEKKKHTFFWQPFNAHDKLNERYSQHRRDVTGALKDQLRVSKPGPEDKSVVGSSKISDPSKPHPDDQKVPEQFNNSASAETSKPSNWFSDNALPIGLGAGALGLAGAGYGAYKYMTRNKNKEKKASNESPEERRRRYLARAIYMPALGLTGQEKKSSAIRSSVIKAINQYA